MKKNVLLSCCIALLAVGCDCLDCGNTGISVTPPTLLLSYYWDKEFPDAYTAEEAGATLISSHNWELTTYDPSRIQLSQIGLNGTGGIHPFKVSYTEDFMKVIQEELIPAMRDETPLEEFPYSDEVGGYKMSTLTFTSNEGQTASLSVFYYAAPPQPFTLWQGGDITLIDTPFLYEIEEIQHPEAPNFNFYDDWFIPAGPGSMAFETTLSARINSDIQIGEGNLTLNEDIKADLLAHLEEVWNAYTLQQTNDGNIDTEFFNTYVDANAYTNAATTLLAQSSLLKLNVKRDLNRAEFHFSFDRELTLPYPIINEIGALNSNRYHALCPNVSVIDIIRNIITQSNATIGIYTLELSNDAGSLLRKDYAVKIDGKLWVTQENDIEASSVTEVSITKENFNKLYLYFNNSFDGQISIENIPFKLTVEGENLTYHPDRCDYFPGLAIYIFGSYIGLYNRNCFQLEFNVGTNHRYLYGLDINSALPPPFQWWYAPQLLRQHKIDLSKSCFYDILYNSNIKVFWDISGKGLPIGKIHYKDATDASCEVMVYLKITAADLRVLLHTEETMGGN